MPTEQETQLTDIDFSIFENHSANDIPTDDNTDAESAPNVDDNNNEAIEQQEVVEAPQEVVQEEASTEEETIDLDMFNDVPDEDAPVVQAKPVVKDVLDVAPDEAAHLSRKAFYDQMLPEDAERAKKLRNYAFDEVKDALIARATYSKEIEQHKAMVADLQAKYKEQPEFYAHEDGYVLNPDWRKNQNIKIELNQVDQVIENALSAENGDRVQVPVRDANGGIAYEEQEMSNALRNNLNRVSIGVKTQIHEVTAKADAIKNLHGETWKSSVSNLEGFYNNLGNKLPAVLRPADDEVASFMQRNHIPEHLQKLPGQRQLAQATLIIGRLTSYITAAHKQLAAQKQAAAVRQPKPKAKPGTSTLKPGDEVVDFSMFTTDPNDED